MQVETAEALTQINMITCLGFMDLGCRFNIIFSIVMIGKLSGPDHVEN